MFAAGKAPFLESLKLVIATTQSPSVAARKISVAERLHYIIRMIDGQRLTVNDWRSTPAQ
jgi:hypothetical protein